MHCMLGTTDPRTILFVTSRSDAELATPSGGIYIAFIDIGAYNLYMPAAPKGTIRGSSNRYMYMCRQGHVFNEPWVTSMVHVCQAFAIERFESTRDVVTMLRVQYNG